MLFYFCTLSRSCNFKINQFQFSDVRYEIWNARNYTSESDCESKITYLTSHIFCLGDVSSLDFLIVRLGMAWGEGDMIDKGIKKRLKKIQKEIKKVKKELGKTELRPCQNDAELKYGVPH